MKLDLLYHYDVVIFDCDGVLLDVNLLKCDAFGEAVKGYPKQTVENFVEHCKNNFGVSRYIKFKEFIDDFAKESFNEEVYDNLLKNYADKCKEIYKYADITPGTITLLKELKFSNKKLFVASGSDEEELNNAFKDRKLISYFNGIFGSPKTKMECTSNILKKNPGCKAVFIGDALSDMKTAKVHGLDFIYMSKYTVQSDEQDNSCKQEAKMVISTLEDLI